MSVEQHFPGSGDTYALLFLFIYWRQISSFNFSSAMWYFLMIYSPILSPAAPRAPATQNWQPLDPGPTENRWSISSPQEDCIQQQWVSLALCQCLNGSRVERACLRPLNSGGCSGSGSRSFCCVHPHPLPPPPPLPLTILLLAKHAVLRLSIEWHWLSTSTLSFHSVTNVLYGSSQRFVLAI